MLEQFNQNLNESLQSAVLFLVFNRPEPTSMVFEAIRKAEPARLYIASDGPREGRAGEGEVVNQVRRIVANIDWPCEVKTLFRQENLGCKCAVSSAIDWFFENEEQGIILEDDCLPAKSFFKFCEYMLERYKDDERIWQISGTTWLPEKISLSEPDYIFSRYGPIWGWASWRRAWRHYDVEMPLWPAMRSPDVMKSVYPHKAERQAKLKIGDKLALNQIDTWDYQWAFVKAFNSALTITPKLNQVVNIGFDENATHTFTSSAETPKVFHEMSEQIVHAEFVIPDRIYEQAYADHHFNRANFITRLRNKLSMIWRQK